MLQPHRSRSAAPVGPAAAEVLRIVCASGTPVYLTVHADGRRRYSYWRPFDADTGRGSCYVALSTVECDALHSAGRITLGEAVVDPSRTTYRVRPTRTPAEPVRAVHHRTRAA
ncbi:hypothetical protein M2271_000303 [Streptomyces sp. LBL]|nr:hypothetical protein [Streptomyces sp. LBL]